MSNNQGPMGDPRETRNLFFAILLSLAVILGWQHFIEAPKQEALKAQQAAQLAASPVPVAGGDALVPTTAPTPAETAPTIISTPVTREAALTEAGQRIKIETPELQGSFSLRGSRFDDVLLTNYRETVDPQSPEIKLLNPAAAMLDPYYVEFGWRSDNTAVPLPGPNTVWTIASGNTLTPDHPVTLSWDNGAGLKFIKEISIDEHYMFTVTQKVISSAATPVQLTPYGLVARGIDPNHKGIYLQHEGPIGVLGGVLKEDKYADVKEQSVISHTSTGGWYGFTDKYWLVALVPDQSMPITARAVYAGQVGPNRYQVDYLGTGQTVAPGGTMTLTQHFFAGAKELRLLDGYEKSLGVPRFDLAIDFGWYYFITKPFFYALDILARMFAWLGFTGNFGLAILAFTVVVKALLFPLADHSYKSMAKMKAVSPKLQELREQHASDPQRQSQEMMALYKREGINPLSGCWPMLIQIPIFFSLYKVLYVSIEMRHAPFYGWIKDLSAGDPSNIFTLMGLINWTPPGLLHIGLLPVLMGVSMWAQMKMNPPPTDPTQKMVFGLMPLLLTFSMAQFAVGLVIYWTWSNILSMAQQYLIMRRMHVKAF